MLVRSLVRAVAVLSLVALGCHGSHGSSPSEPARRDALSRVSISPAEGTILPYGSTTVDFSVRVHYSFASADRGSVGLIVYPGSAGRPAGVPILTEPSFFPVEGQEGDTTLRVIVHFETAEPALPKGARVTLDFSLFPEGVKQTTIGFTSQYQLGS
ncbi:MAG TPA: hypothetical protein VMM92_07035 [Thermoanaerobaculia bacterium]|nr:hypothetical protein [Thermoanaerobaculia bacterium]